MARLIGGESISKTKTKTKTKSKSKAFRFIYGLALNKQLQPQPGQARPGQSSPSLYPCHMQHQAGSVCMHVCVCELHVPQTGVIIYT